MPKINFEKLVKSKRNKVFDIAANYKEFQKTLPQYFPSIRVCSERDNVAIVEEHIRIGEKELVMMTKHVTKYPEIHEVFVIGGDAKGSHIIERYQDVPGGTKITIYADIKLSGRMKFLSWFSKGKLKDGLVKIMDEFASIAEN